MSLFPTCCRLFRFRQSCTLSVQLLSGGSGSGTAREKSAAESRGACIACFHSRSSTHKIYLRGEGPSPPYSQMKDFFLSWIPAEGGHWSALPLEEMQGQLSEVMGLSPPGQADGGWLVPAGWVAAAAAAALLTRP